MTLSSASICVLIRTSSETLRVGSKRNRMLIPEVVLSLAETAERGQSE